HGKLESKIDKSDNLWGNKLDKLVRNMQDGQTLGIPTGPDTSRVISEIIGVALDKIIQTSEPNLNGIRFIDDFFIYSDSAADSESISHKINKALGDFELTSNDNKTSVQKMPAPIESLQLQTIRHYKIRKSAPEQKLDIIHLYNLAIDVHRNNPKDNAFHYFLTKVMPIRIHEDNWP
ncbi:RNA-directed DNA polymerase, partial [Vibrio parahaemolyticus]|nr:RNA-directed DNA polymerase [Vibrio parahaemolyticus]